MWKLLSLFLFLWVLGETASKPYEIEKLVDVYVYNNANNLRGGNGKSCGNDEICLIANELINRGTFPAKADMVLVYTGSGENLNNQHNIRRNAHESGRFNNYRRHSNYQRHTNTNYHGSYPNHNYPNYNNHHVHQNHRGHNNHPVFPQHPSHGFPSGQNIPNTNQGPFQNTSPGNFDHPHFNPNPNYPGNFPHHGQNNQGYIPCSHGNCRRPQGEQVRPNEGTIIPTQGNIRPNQGNVRPNENLSIPTATPQIPTVRTTQPTTALPRITTATPVITPAPTPVQIVSSTTTEEDEPLYDIDVRSG